MPLAYAITRQGWGYPVERMAWWVAVTLALGFLADAVAFRGHTRLVSNLYPILIGSMLGAILLPARHAIAFSGLLTICAFGSLAYRGGEGLDVLTRTVAFGGGTVMAWRTACSHKLRWALTVLFGGGTLAWYGYVLDPSWPTWLTLQGVRLVGTVWLCAAV